MDKNRWQKIEDIFHEASMLSGAEREAYLVQACAEDADIEADVRDMLASDSEATADAFLSSSILNQDENLEAGERIGPYKILEVLGEGGMGTVYAVEQEGPIKRKAALKIVKAGMDSKRILRRFFLEQKTLARMNHPFIAHAYDAGSTENGRPYFVMEYVEGEPITRFCDRHHYNLEQRLNLFKKVCEGIRHAHQKGCIHRDIKPGNVLVTMIDGAPSPKIIDFGIVRGFGMETLDGEDLQDESMLTLPGMAIGTPDYMSPEQADLSDKDIDTRTDVYALGVLLHELLVGFLPLRVQAFNTSGLSQALNTIRTVKPAKPSECKGLTEAELFRIAELRQTTPSRLKRGLRGDLDWVVLKALEKERDRRYSGAAAFSEDIDRYLNGEPVHAGPPSLAYRVSKFAMRHRAAVTLGLAIPVVAFAALTIGLLEAKRMEREARREAEKTKQALKWMDNLITSPDPLDRGPDLKVVDLLDRFQEQLKEEHSRDPEVDAAVKHSLGASYITLSEFEKAEQFLTDAYETRKANLGTDHPDTLFSYYKLAFLYLEAKQYKKAIPIFEKLIAQNYLLAEDDENLRYVESNYANALMQLNRFEESENVLDKVILARTERLGADSAKTLSAYQQLGTLKLHQGQYKAASSIFKDTWEKRIKVLGADHPFTLKSALNYAYTLATIGKADEGLQTAEDTIQALRKVYGVDHSYTLQSELMLAQIYSANGDPSKAEALTIATSRKIKDRLGERSDLYLSAVNQISALYAGQGNWLAAADTQEELVRVWTEKYSPNHLQTMIVRNNQAYMRFKGGDLEQALSLMAALHRDSLQHFEKGHYIVAVVTGSYCDMLTAKGDYLNAVAQAEETLPSVRETLGELGKPVLDLELTLAAALIELDHREKARDILRPSLERHLQVFGENSSKTKKAKALLASIEVNPGK